MVLISWPSALAVACARWPMLRHIALLLSIWVIQGSGMTDETITALRQDTRDLFYHGYSNYLIHAFPEDELKPISCQPQTRNGDDPADIGLNDVLGNYSLTLIDSLSSLAILASGEDEVPGRDALQDFQSGVQELVKLYGNGSRDSCGSRACGFDLDSKVQVFETNIRGVGGLLSAHLFATGDLPIRGYEPKWTKTSNGVDAIDWNGWLYTNQLLMLARDLAMRLLPAFSTKSGLPYPRVNLRKGIPFYQNQEPGICLVDGTSSPPPEITETCAAGAGSLVLEFTTLSRLTGESIFEDLAKQAFWGVWNRRSTIDLIGSGIDAESGQWMMPPLAGVGAGIDSFLEYAFKSHVLLSNLPSQPGAGQQPPNSDFLSVWQQAHAAIKRHVRRGTQTEKHPFYAQADSGTGGLRYTWVDNLSAYYPGLLTLAGELDEAIEAHLLYAALWMRYSALPERWQVYSANIDPNFKHWAGRPEFIESTYYLYQATKDPYYLHVGEMALRDIWRRCWTECGWADLGDVITGEQRDRMESFFLGETAKYLYLLFDPSHPLNHIDAPIVFTTEGHPLIIPKSIRQALQPKRHIESEETQEPSIHTEICSIPPPPLPLTVSNTANRADLFHAAAQAQLHIKQVGQTRTSPIREPSIYDPGISLAGIRRPTNYSFYPWTLPADLIPAKGFSSRIKNSPMSTLTFPNMTPGRGQADENAVPFGALQKVLEGVVINSFSNMRLNMIEEPTAELMTTSDGSLVEIQVGKEYRVSAVANWNLGRDERVLVTDKAFHTISATDTAFRRVKDLEMVDLVIDVPTFAIETSGQASSAKNVANASENDEDAKSLWDNVLEAMATKLLSNMGPALVAQLQAMNKSHGSVAADKSPFSRHIVTAVLPTGVGAAPLPAEMDNDVDPRSMKAGDLPFSNILYLDDNLCSHRLPIEAAKTHSILVINRGGCSFSEKLANIPAVAPSPQALQLTIVVSLEDDQADGGSLLGHARDPDLIRPLLDRPQLTPAGLERHNVLSMVMVDGSEATVRALRGAATTIAAFDAHGEMVSFEVPSRFGEGGRSRPGLAVKRRFWFESQGLPIKNLMML